MRKKTLSIMLACAATMVMTTPAFAAGWQKDNVGWWYQNDDGTYPKKEWKWRRSCVALVWRSCSRMQVSTVG